MKFYAVRKGRLPGVYTSWDECKKQVDGFSGAEYKAFKTESDAIAFIAHQSPHDKTVSQNDVSCADTGSERIVEEQIKGAFAEGCLVAFTDGSFDEVSGRYSCGVVLLEKGKAPSELCKRYDDKMYSASRNVAGEIFGVLEALEWAVKNSYRKVRIFHDYIGVSKWADGSWNADKPISRYYKKILEDKYSDIVEISFFQVPAHSGIDYNEKADALAKSSLLGCSKPVVGDNYIKLRDYKYENFKELHKMFSEFKTSDGYKCKVEPENLKEQNQFKLYLNKDTLTLSYFSSKYHTLLVQGKHGVLSQLLLEYLCKNIGDITELQAQIHNRSADKNKVEACFEQLGAHFFNAYPEALKKLFQISISDLFLLETDLDREDYTSFLFQPYRLLEGHLLYKLRKYKITVGAIGKVFEKNEDQRYVVKDRYLECITDSKDKNYIERLYDYYRGSRNPIFHAGYFLGENLQTQFISDKNECKRLIKECLNQILDKDFFK